MCVLTTTVCGKTSNMGCVAGSTHVPDELPAQPALPYVPNQWIILLFGFWFARPSLRREAGDVLLLRLWQKCVVAPFMTSIQTIYRNILLPQLEKAEGWKQAILLLAMMRENFQALCDDEAYERLYCQETSNPLAALSEANSINHSMTPALSGLWSSDRRVACALLCGVCVFCKHQKHLKSNMPYSPPGKNVAGQATFVTSLYGSTEAVFQQTPLILWHSAGKNGLGLYRDYTRPYDEAVSLFRSVLYLLFWWHCLSPVLWVTPFCIIPSCVTFRGRKESAYW